MATRPQRTMADHALIWGTDILLQKSREGHALVLFIPCVSFCQGESLICSQARPVGQVALPEIIGECDD
jgi:hypothetical protein